MQNLEKIFDRLKINKQNGLYITAENRWKKLLPFQIEKQFECKIKPDAFFCVNNKPIILFYHSPKNKKELFKSIWNFNQSPVVIINEPDSVEIFNGFSFLKDKMSLEKIGGDDQLNDLSYFEFMTGGLLNNHFKPSNCKNRVDYNLLENIKSARQLLMDDHKIDSSMSNALIGKCIFIRYLIDRKVRFNFENNLHIWTNDELCNLLKNKYKTIKFLKYLKDNFNGEAFLLDDNCLNDISDDVLNLLSQLLQGTKIKSGQMSLFDVYDFSIIPVEFISNIYENFIGEKNQASKGAYYTPIFLVEYILSETIDKYYNDQPLKFNCKILDPSCGSGVFLVEALRRIIEQYKKNNKVAHEKESNFKNVLKKITEENIYGIDKDDNAINVAIFSIYLTLLDYQDPKEIEDFKFPKLKNQNFFTADFFDTTANFNQIFSKKKFDFIIGNPPWKRGDDKETLFIKYINKRKKNEKYSTQISISNKEIAQAFLLRTSDLSSANTKCAFIVTSKTLYNINAVDFRKYFLHNYFIEKVFELAPVRREIFDKSNDPAIAPAAILFFHYADGKNTNNNVIHHITLKPNRFFSLFKIITIQSSDYKKVLQSRLKEFDWLWKILVYGNYLDFNFINRLKNDYKTINDFINENKFLSGQGIQYGQDMQNAKELFGFPLIDVKHINPYFIENSENLFSQEYVHRARDKRLFDKNKLLVKKGLNQDLKLISAISYKKGVFKDSLTAIKSFSDNDIKKLRLICGLLQSVLFSYFIIQTGSSVGIEREQVFDEEKFNFPVVEKLLISKHVEKIEKLTAKISNESKKLFSKISIQKLENVKTELVNKLDNEIFNIFKINNQERSLINYAVDVCIPLITKQYDNGEIISPIEYNSQYLINYINIYFDRFKGAFERVDKSVAAKIICNKYVLGIFFKVLTEKNKPQSIIWERYNDEQLLVKLLSLGINKITNDIFITKDIRGFENDGFYIIKPNEKKLWHEAIAYYDADIFANAMLDEGRK